MISYAVFCFLVLSIRRQRQMCIRDRAPAACINLLVLEDRVIQRTLQSCLEIAVAVSYTHLRAHETRHDLVCRLLLSSPLYSSAASDVYKRQVASCLHQSPCARGSRHPADSSVLSRNSC